MTFNMEEKMLRADFSKFWLSIYLVTKKRCLGRINWAFSFTKGVLKQ